MRAPTPNSSASKATTTPRHLQAIALVGGALIGFLVMKTPAARDQLRTLAAAACEQGELSAHDAAMVRHVLAKAPNQP